MFVTHPLPPEEVFSELLTKRPSLESATSRFRDLRHDKDLCPAIRRHASAVRECYKAYKFDCHDIQGIRDEGVDVLVKYETDSREVRIGFQIKSYPEISDYKSGKDKFFIKNLRSQASMAREDLGIKDYYVLLCTDAIEHRSQIRNIVSAFKKYSYTHIILPEQILSFMDMSKVDVEMSTARMLCRSDMILEGAQKSIDGLPGIEALLLLHVLCTVHEGHREIHTEDILSFASEWNERGVRADHHDIADAISSLEGSDIIQHNGAQAYVIHADAMPTALSALYFDLRVRYMLRSGEVLPYLMSLLEDELDLSSR